MEQQQQPEPPSSPAPSEPSPRKVRLNSGGRGGSSVEVGKEQQPLLGVGGPVDVVDFRGQTLAGYAINQVESRVTQKTSALIVSECSIDPAGAQVIASLVNRFRLERLDISCNAAGPGIANLTQVLQTNTSLSWLNLLQNGLEVKDAQKLVELKAHKPELSTLCGLSFTLTQQQRFVKPASSISSGCVALLCGENLEGLEELDLSANGLGPDAEPPLAQLIATLPKLSKVSLLFNAFSGKGAKLLCATASDRAEGKAKITTLCGLCLDDEQRRAETLEFAGPAEPSLAQLAEAP